MPKRDRAAYMRDYRARQRSADEPIGDSEAVRIAELEAEVARLKRELSQRPTDRQTAQARRDAILRGIQRGSA
jgi:hypothetical protein